MLGMERLGCYTTARLPRAEPKSRVRSLHLPSLALRCRLRRSGLPAAPPDSNQVVSCRLGLHPVPASTHASSASAAGGLAPCTAQTKSSTCTVCSFAIAGLSLDCRPHCTQAGRRCSAATSVLAMPSRRYTFVCLGRPATPLRAQSAAATTSAPTAS